ncbi:hypothetical protein M3558_09595 [Brevibacillus invocatus]|nr:hypothetical protein [Brevibacillus invocatus]
MAQVHGKSGHYQQQQDHFSFPPCSLTTASQNLMSAKNTPNESANSSMETASILVPPFPLLKIEPSRLSRLPSCKFSLPEKACRWVKK